VADSDTPALDNPPPDLGYTGDAMDYWVPGCVVAYRRHGSVVTFGINNTVVPLNPDQAEDIARHLYAASVAARTAREAADG
jgi:hypothetical protein